MDTKLERLDEIKSTVSNLAKIFFFFIFYSNLNLLLAKKFDHLNDRVLHVEESYKEARVKVQQLDGGLTELNTEVKEFNIANEHVQKDCHDNCKGRCTYMEEVYSRRENLRFYGISEEGE